MAKKYLDEAGLLYFWTKIKAHVASAVSGKQDTLTFDNAPTENSDNPVKSGGIYTAIQSLDTGVSDVTVDGSSVVSSGVAAIDLTGKVDVVSGKGLSTEDYTTAEKTKLSGVETGAQANVQSDWDQTDSSADDYIKNKPSIPSGVVVDSALSTTSENPVQNKIITGALNDKIDASEIGAASGVAPLDANSLIDEQYLPSYVDDVVEAYPISGATELSAGWLSETSGGSALTPSAGVIYVLMQATTNYAANSQFRWGGSTYVALTDGSGMSSITNAEIDTIVAA